LALRSSIRIDQTAFLCKVLWEVAMRRPAKEGVGKLVAFHNREAAETQPVKVVSLDDARRETVAR
jgi:hypothetical protein